MQRKSTQNAVPTFRNIFSKTAYHSILESRVSKILSVNSFLPVSSLLFENHITERASWILTFLKFPKFSNQPVTLQPINDFLSTPATSHSDSVYVLNSKAC